MEDDYTLIDPSLNDMTDTGGTGTGSVGNTASPATATPSAGTSTGGFSIGNFLTQVTPLVTAGAGIVAALKTPAKVTAPAGTAGAAAIPTTATATNWQKWAIIGFGCLLVFGLLFKFLGRGK